MNTDKLKDLIANSDLNQMSKNVLTGFVLRSAEREDQTNAVRELIEKIASEKNVDEILISTEEVKIYTTRGKDEWEKKYPFRSIYKDNNGNWTRCSTVSPTLDLAMLVCMGQKYEGGNSRFADYAAKMLDIKIEE